MDVEQIWSKTLDIIKPQVNSYVFSTWFINANLIKVEKDVATIVVPALIHKKHLNDTYSDLIITSLQTVTNNTYSLSFKLEDEIQEEVKEEPKEKKKPKKDEETTKEEDNNYIHHSNLNKDYNFDTFIVGNSNKLAKAAAMAVAEAPGITYNPLFIYGTSGLGKTHLMHAIGNYIEETTNKKVLYVTSNQFVDNFIAMSRNNNNQDHSEFFKNKYRDIDVLIVDDIQFLANKPKTEEEFFHIFNDLHNNKKQIIISSDRSPNDLKELEDRLKTRFTWGLSVDIYPPEFELRKNILRKKIEQNSVLSNISEDVIEYIASNMTSDVRKLEGAITTLMAHTLIMGDREIDLSFAVDALKDVINKGTSEKTNILRVQKAVADYFQISVDDLKSKKRSASIAFPRQIAMYLSRTLLNESFERIGLEFGGKDHSTVMHSCDKIKSDCETNSEIRNCIEKIKENII